MSEDALVEVLKESDKRMVQSLESLKRELATIRTGRANPSILDRVRVEYYGEKVPVNQVGTISAPEARLLLVSVWDKEMVKPVVDAITSSDLGLNPNSDGNIIRVPLPQLTTERRKELAKQVSRKSEDAKVGVRNTRREMIEKLRSMQRSGTISEDDLDRYQEQVQKITDAHIKQVEAAEGAKADEVLAG